MVRKYLHKNSENKRLTVEQFFEQITAIENLSETVFSIFFTPEFKKSVKSSYAQNLDLQLLLDVIRLLSKDERLPQKNYEHVLKGEYKGVWECHIKPDWLLMWLRRDAELSLLLLNTTTHSEFMNKKRNKRKKVNE